MLTIPVKPITVDEFLLLSESEPASEYTNKKITQKTMPKGRHSRLQGKLCQEIDQVSETKKLPMYSQS